MATNSFINENNEIEYVNKSNIHYISIFDKNKKFGDSINNAIAAINYDEDDWILLRDLDVAFLTPDAGNLINEATKSGYDLIGCYTNRLGSDNQTGNSALFVEPSLFEHYEIASKRISIYGSEVKPFQYDVAGMFMLFSVKIWRKIGGFKNSIVFDREFTKAVRMNGGKVGIMPGLYVLHCYRLWAPTRDEAKKSVQHLIK